MDVVNGAPLWAELLKLTLIFLIMVGMVPLLVWVERRGSAFIQNRFGPNRIGPMGLLQTLADAVKFAFKEEFMPAKEKKIYFLLAPVLALIPAALALATIPLTVPVVLKNSVLSMQGYDFGADLVVVLGLSSLGAYSLLLAGWSSNNKYSLMGGLRACAQMISYELGLSLSLVGTLMIYGTLSFNKMIEIQSTSLSFMYFGEFINIGFLPNWGIFYQPLGALLFLTCVFAECNRLPFDLPEAEAELVAGYHTEYGGLKMLMFYIGEYGHMIVGASLTVVMFFGGHDLIFIEATDVRSILLDYSISDLSVSLLVSSFFLIGFLLKVFVLLWFFIWVRWTLPRFRYDQLMDLGWKKILPWGLFNSFVTAAVLFAAHS